MHARNCAQPAKGRGSSSWACTDLSLCRSRRAGDFFTAGFLTAYLRGGSLQQCAAAGCAAGCEAVQTKGAELPPAAFTRLRVRAARRAARTPYPHAAAPRTGHPVALSSLINSRACKRATRPSACRSSSKHSPVNRIALRDWRRAPWKPSSPSPSPSRASSPIVPSLSL
jgi:hypothetical protein